VVLTSVISAGYYLRLVTVMFMRPKAPAPQAARVQRPGGLTESVVIVSVVLLLALGLMPSYLVKWSAGSIPVVAPRSYYPPPSTGRAP
jgi:NADH:ubiquinone oxidoreductase subunit 2 (subunit N)